MQRFTAESSVEALYCVGYSPLLSLTLVSKYAMHIWCCQRLHQ